MSPQSAEEVYQKALYILLFYLSGQFDQPEYGSATRKDMIEGILEDLFKHNLLTDEIHERGVQLVSEAYKNHPLKAQVVAALENLPREPDETLNHAMNAFMWVQASNKETQGEKSLPIADELSRTTNDLLEQIEATLHSDSSKSQQS